jgi:hypothetical protein
MSRPKLTIDYKHRMRAIILLRAGLSKADAARRLQGMHHTENSTLQVHRAYFPKTGPLSLERFIDMPVEGIPGKKTRAKKTVKKKTDGQKKKKTIEKKLTDTERHQRVADVLATFSSREVQIIDRLFGFTAEGSVSPTVLSHATGVPVAEIKETLIKFLKGLKNQNLVAELSVMFASNFKRPRK